MEFAAVKFLIDNECAVVPVNFIKNFDSKKDVFIPGEKREVFWSPLAGQTPRDLQEENGYIPSVDKLKEKHRIGRDAGDRDPIPGYYEAEILKLAGTKNELDTCQGKRLKKPSQKQAEILKEKCIKKEPPVAAKKTSERKKSKSVQPGEKANIIALLKEPRSYKVPSSNSEADDDEDEVVPMKILTEKTETLKREVASLRERKNTLLKKVEALEDEKQILRGKNESLLNEIETLKKYNLHLQSMLFDTKSLKSSSSCENTSNTSNVFASSSESSSLLSPKQAVKRRSNSPIESLELNRSPLRKKVVSSPCRRSPRLHTSPTLTLQKKLNFENEPDPSSEPEQVGAETSSPSHQKKLNFENEPNPSSEPEQVGAEISSPSPQKKKFHLTEVDLRNVLHKVQPGKAGDSLYAKNLAVAIFGLDLLGKSSVTGGISNRLKNTEKGPSQPKPALPEEGWNYLVELYEKRVMLDFKEGLDEAALKQLKERKKAVKKHVGDKINKLRCVKASVCAAVSQKQLPSVEKETTESAAAVSQKQLPSVEKENTESAAAVSQKQLPSVEKETTESAAELQDN